MFLNANYWLEEDARLLNLLPDYQELINYEDDNPIWEIRHRQSEVMLWRLVVAYRNGNDEWRRLADQFFSDYTASQFHHRFFLYLQSNPRLENALFERQRRFFEAKTNVATGEYDRAAEIFSALIPTLSVSEIRGYFSPRSIRDLGRAYLYSESAGGAGAELMGALLPMLETSNSGVAHEWLGRLYNAVDSHNLSARHFREALEITPDDRHLWLYFREILEIGPRDFAEALEARYNEIDNPAYFSDLLQRLVSELLWGARLGDAFANARYCGGDRSEARSSAMECDIGGGCEDRTLCRYSRATGIASRRANRRLHSKRELFLRRAIGESVGSRGKPCVAIVADRRSSGGCQRLYDYCGWIYSLFAFARGERLVENMRGQA